MISVIASIETKPGCRAKYLEILRANVPLVRNEAGCIEYVPTIDLHADLPPQVLDENMVTLIEKWESLGALHAHLAAPHMLEYRGKVKDLVERVTLKVLTEA